MEEALPKEDLTTVEGFKKYLLAKNNANTESSILEGFPWADLIFSMSKNAQINWSNFKDIPDALFPYPVTSKDDGDIVNVELVDRENFYYTVLGFKSEKLQAGSVIRELIKACITMEELETIEATM